MSKTYLELIADSDFMDEFTMALFLLHTSIGDFPSAQTPEQGSARQRGI